MILGGFMVALAPALLANGSPAPTGQVRHPPDACPPQSCAIEPARDLSPEEARQALGAFAACMAKKYPGRLRAVLDKPFFDEKTKEWMKALPGSRCVASANVGLIAMQPLVLRGAFFGALYAHDFQPAASAGAFPAQKPDYPVAEGPDGSIKADGRTQTYLQLMTVGECVVRKAPETARDLTLSKIDSKEEQAGVQKVAAIIPHCTDKSMTLSKPIVRMMVAEPLYRLSTLEAASAGATSAKQAS